MIVTIHINNKSKFYFRSGLPEELSTPPDIASSYVGGGEAASSGFPSVGTSELVTSEHKSVDLITKIGHLIDIFFVSLIDWMN